ncbi:MAG: hypothetical protein K9I85_06375 [Saprospiraceae bacterium]|nr:hypothetical protein [Saprospiraceae bacterium]
MNSRNKYHFYKKELSKLLKSSEIVSFHDDENIIDRIVNLLSEGNSIKKIKGIISASEIVKYGGDVTDEEVEEIYQEIIEWWNEKE